MQQANATDGRVVSCVSYGLCSANLSFCLIHTRTHFPPNPQKPNFVRFSLSMCCEHDLSCRCLCFPFLSDFVVRLSVVGPSVALGSPSEYCAASFDCKCLAGHSLVLSHHNRASTTPNVDDNNCLCLYFRFQQLLAAQSHRVVDPMSCPRTLTNRNGKNKTKKSQRITIK